MNKQSLWMIPLVAALLLSAVLPVSAAAGSRVGNQIPVRFDRTFPAGQPFHIAHGWWNPTNIPGVGLFAFSLDLDGIPVKEDFIERSAISGTPDELLWVWVFNFPDGMTGTHTFTGHWTGPCQGLVDMGVIPGPCGKTNEIIESATRTIVVDFIP